MFSVLISLSKRNVRVATCALSAPFFCTSYNWVMRALVTGGAGFIGSNLVRLLLEHGHSVRVLDDLSSGYAENLRPFPEVRVVHGDVREERAVVDSSRDVDVIFHMAAAVGNKRSIARPVFDSQVNVIGTIRVLEAARINGVSKVVFSSSAGVFGELKTLPISESHPLDPDSPYGVSKLAAEKMCVAYDKLYGISTVCLRYFNVYGLNQRYDEYGNVIPIFVRSMLRGEPITIFGDGEQTRDFINVADVAMANMQAAFAHGVSGVFNLGSGTRISINDLVDRLRLLNDADPQVLFGPPRQGDVRDSLADISAAHRAFGFTPAVRLEEGLPAYVAWARATLAGAPLLNV